PIRRIPVENKTAEFQRIGGCMDTVIVSDEASYRKRDFIFSASMTVIGVYFIVFYVLLPGEGILRKWVFSDFEKVFGFVRDPVLIAMYGVYFLKSGRRLGYWVIPYFWVAVFF